MAGHTPRLVLGLWLVMSAPGLAASADPAALYETLRAGSVDPARAVKIERTLLRVGPAIFDIEEGILFPGPLLGGRAAEMVFIGNGNVQAHPPDDIEAGQIELFTGERSIAANFSTAVLVVAENGDADILLAGKPVEVDDETSARASEIYQRWKGSTVRRLAGVESALFQDALGDPSMGTYFAAWFVESDLGEFHCIVDPTVSEQVTIGKFVPIDPNAKEQRQIDKWERREKSRGRLVGTSADDLGVFDTWMSTPLIGRDGTPVPARSGFEPFKYEIDVTITKGAQEISGTATVLVKAVTDASTLNMTLDTDLSVSRILDDSGRPLFFTRNGDDLTVPLPDVVKSGWASKFTVEFQGSPIERVVRKSWVLRTTEAWYPRIGNLDRALYDVTYRWPKNLGLMAGGKRVGEGVEGDTAWERRVFEIPVSWVSFEVGDFAIQETIAGPLQVRVAFPKWLSKSNPYNRSTRFLVTNSVRSSLEFFQQAYGELPLEEITVVVVDRAYSQGFFGFVTLSSLALSPYKVFDSVLSNPKTLIAHEVAHQWWGNLVGWEGYRDQWISEAVAEYSAILYAQRQLGFSRKMLFGSFRNWADYLEVPIEGGRSYESLGPIVLGKRLASSKAERAYQAIVYLKGMMVLDMLGRFFRDEMFFATVLRKIARDSAFRRISTADFLGEIEKMSGKNLDWFRQQYIYGTGVPVVLYSYDLDAGEGEECRVSGTARQQPTFRFRPSITRLESGYDVTKSKMERLDVGSSQIVVPFEMEVRTDAEGEDGKKKRGRRTPEPETRMHGRLLLKGEKTDFTVNCEGDAETFSLGRNGEVLAYFLDEKTYPKLSLLNKGRFAQWDDDLEQAERLMLEALQAPISVRPTKGRRPLVQQGRRNLEDVSDARVYLLLAGVYLDKGEPDEALRSLKNARISLRGMDQSGYQHWFDRIEARAGIQKGEFDKAYRKLDTLLSDRIRVVQTEDLLLLAIAARALGRPEEMDKALERAEELGADVSALRAKGK